MSIQQTMDDFLNTLRTRAKDCPELMDLFVNCYTTVSYTHLDVYKRQA